MTKAAVIGAGVGGLAIAIRLAARGFQVSLYEQSGKVGGKMNEIRLGAYRFDTGPSLFTLPELFDKLVLACGKKPEDYLRFHKLELSCQYFFPDGKTIKAWAEQERFLKETGLEAEKVEAYLKHQTFIYENTSEFFLFNPIHKLSVFAREAVKQNLKAVFKMGAFQSMHQQNVQKIGQNHLVQLFDRYATYNGSNPFEAPATLNMIAHLEHTKGAWLPEGGMYAFAQALLKLAVDMQVNIHLNSPVQEVVSGKDKVTGIRVNDTLVEADYVINDTDISYFYQHLLPNKRKFDALNRRERSSSAMIFYWGMNIQSGLDLHNILFSEAYKAEFKALFKQKTLADDLTVYIYISSKLNHEDAPEGKENWFVMVNAPEHVGQDWQEQTRRAREIIIQQIEKQVGIKVAEHLEEEKILTPPEIEQLTASYHGSLYGHSSNSILAAFKRHPNFSRKYDNLFFVGGSVHPGGGIPLCLASAQIVDSLISI